MKNALKKIMLTDTDTQSGPKFNIPTWKDDAAFMKWNQKSQEISQQIMEAEAQERYIHEELRQTEEKAIRLKSEVLLGEGSESDLKEAEASVERLLQRKIGNYKEIQALEVAKTRAEKETTKAEEEAKTKAMQIVLPLYQNEVAKTLEILQAGDEQNKRVEEFEALASKRGLSLNGGSFGSPYVIRNLSFPEGLKEFWKSVEGLLYKKTL